MLKYLSLLLLAAIAGCSGASATTGPAKPADVNNVVDKMSPIVHKSEAMVEDKNAKEIAIFKNVSRKIADDLEKAVNRSGDDGQTALTLEAAHDKALKEFETLPDCRYDERLFSAHTNLKSAINCAGLAGKSLAIADKLPVESERFQQNVDNFGEGLGLSRHHIELFRKDIESDTK